MSIAVWFGGDVSRLLLGLFGPPWRRLATGVLVSGLLISVVAWLRCAARGSTRQRALTIIAALLALVTLVKVAREGRRMRSETVQFPGSDIAIAATLYLPDSPGPHPALVLVPGSAPFKRGLYDLWAAHFAKAGFAVLVADKRGVGGTGGVFERDNNGSRKNLTLLATDVVAALNYAATRADIDSSCIGLLGLSQAGWVAPLAATMTPRARFLTMISAPTVSVGEEGAWSDLRGDDERAARLSRAAAERVIDTVPPRGVDARKLLGQLDIPGLWLFGADDNSIPSAKSAAVLDSLARTAGKRFTFDTFPGYGHLLIGRGSSVLPRVAPQSWNTLTRWLRDRCPTGR
jgi:uncharacterized protein